MVWARVGSSWPLGTFFGPEFGMERHTYCVRPVMLGTPSAYGFHSSSSEFFNMGGMKTLMPGETSRAQMGGQGF